MDPRMVGWTKKNWTKTNWTEENELDGREGREKKNLTVLSAIGTGKRGIGNLPNEQNKQARCPVLSPTCIFTCSLLVDKPRKTPLSTKPV